MDWILPLIAGLGIGSIAEVYCRSFYGSSSDIERPMVSGETGSIFRASHCATSGSSVRF